MRLRLQPRLRDQLQAFDIFVLAAGRQQQHAAIGRIGLLARHDAVGPGHAPALDAAVERKLDADEAQHVGVLLRLDRRDALLDLGLAHRAVEHVGAHRHLAGVVHRAVERDLPLVDAGLDHADDAVGVEIAHRDLRAARPCWQAAAAGSCARDWRRSAAARRSLRPLLVAHDHAALRVRRVLGDAGKLQRLAS